MSDNTDNSVEMETHMDPVKRNVIRGLANAYVKARGESASDPKVRQPLPVLPERSDDYESRDILGLAEDLRGLGSRTSVLRSGKRACSKSKARQRRIFPKLSLVADMHADEDEDGRGEVDRGDADGRGQKQSPGSDLL